MNKLVKTILGISQSMSINIKDKKIITLPEVYQYGPNSIRDTKKARQLMTILTEHGYALPSTNGAEFEGMIRKEAYEVRVWLYLSLI